jgi:hypothetical protein
MTIAIVLSGTKEGKIITNMGKGAIKFGKHFSLI